MEKDRVIVTGSEGLIGSSVVAHLKKTYKVLKLSYRFGHNLTDERFVKKWFAENKAEYLVNCYGLSDSVHIGENRTSLFEVSLESVAEFLRVNVVSLFSVCREFAKNKEAKGIVNLSSIYGLVSPLPELYQEGEKHIGYSISKAAVIELTKHLAVHLAPRVRVNCIVSGGIRDKQGKGFIKRYSKHVPFGRMMESAELNGMINLLCSDLSSYVTGSVVVVDGGWTSV